MSPKNISMTRENVPQIPATWVVSIDQLKSLCAAWAETDREDMLVTVDLETTGLNEHENNSQIVLASITVGCIGVEDSSTWLVPLSHPSSPFARGWRDILKLICQSWENHKIKLNNHHLKFDLRWIYRHTGIDLSKNIYWDTLLSSSLLDENRSNKLKEIVPDTFGVSRWDEFNLSRPWAAYHTPLVTLGEYAAKDTYYAHELAKYHITKAMNPAEVDDVMWWEAPEIAATRQLSVLMHHTVIPTYQTLTQMEERGIQLDVTRCEIKKQELEKITEQMFDKLANHFPEIHEMEINTKKSFAATSTWFKKWAEIAVEKNELRVIETTPTGSPKWDRFVLKELSLSGYSLADDLLKYKKADKLLSFIRSWEELKSSEDRIYPTYSLGSVVTGRLSSSKPNMQQITKQLKPSFIPDKPLIEGETSKVFVELDYSQIEMRVAAFLSRCAPMMEAFHRGLDLHKLVASKITGAPLDEITSEERQSGKAANFGLLFEMGAKGFMIYAKNQYNLVFTLKEAKDIVEAYHDTWRGLRQWKDSVLSQARRNLFVSSPIGRIRHLPDILSNNSELVNKAEKAAINSPVQGFASDLMQTASALISGNLSEVAPEVADAEIMGTVHDSILVQVPMNSYGIVAIRLCVHYMTNVVKKALKDLYAVDFDIPLEVSISAGTSWGADNLNLSGL